MKNGWSQYQLSSYFWCFPCVGWRSFFPLHYWCSSTLSWSPYFIFYKSSILYTVILSVITKHAVYRVQFNTTDTVFQWHSQFYVLCVLLAISAETKKEKVLEKLFLFKSIWVSLECSTDMVAYSLHRTIKARIQIYIENNSFIPTLQVSKL